jgi:hypothetical protein
MCVGSLGPAARCGKPCVVLAIASPSENDVNQLVIHTDDTARLTPTLTQPPRRKINNINMET